MQVPWQTLAPVLYGPWLPAANRKWGRAREPVWPWPKRPGPPATSTRKGAPVRQSRRAVWGGRGGRNQTGRKLDRAANTPHRTGCRAGSKGPMKRAIRERAGNGYNLGMRAQFNTSALFLTVTFLAVALGGITGGIDYINRIAGSGLFVALFATPIWLPLVFAGYLIGRRSIDLKTVIAITLVEGSILAGLNLFLAPY